MNTIIFAQASRYLRSGMMCEARSPDTTRRGGRHRPCSIIVPNDLMSAANGDIIVKATIRQDRPFRRDLTVRHDCGSPYTQEIVIKSSTTPTRLA